MKRATALSLLLACIVLLVGCGKRSMNDIIAHEPSVTGFVEAVHADYVHLRLVSPDYPDGAVCQVSLDVENKDSVTHFSVGNEIVVYFDGQIAESDPLQIRTVYAITLKTPANRASNDTP